MPTHSSTQCPAVAIQFSLSTAPPHLWVLEKPKNDVRLTDTCHGHLPNGAAFPPTMRVSGRGNNGGTPHWARSLPLSVLALTAETVGTEPRGCFLVVITSAVVVVVVTVVETVVGAGVEVVGLGVDGVVLIAVVIDVDDNSWLGFIVVTTTRGGCGVLLLVGFGRVNDPTSAVVM